MKNARESVLGMLAPPMRAELSFCSFGAQDIAASSNAHLISRPMVTFRPHRLAVAPSCALFFDVLDLRIGPYSQRADVVPTSAEFFPPLPGDTRPTGSAAAIFGTGGASAELFPPLPIKKAERDALKRFERGLGYDTCQRECNISLLIRNKAPASQKFEAILWGVFLYE